MARRRLLNLTLVPPATAFDVNDESTWTLRQSNLVLDQDAETVLNPTFLLPSGDEVLLDSDRMISLGRLRTGIDASETPVWTDSRAWRFPDIRDGDFRYEGSIAIDSNNIFRAFVITNRISTDSPVNEGTKFLKVYDLVVSEPAVLPELQASIDAVKAYYRDPSVNDAAVNTALVMAKAKMKQLSGLDTETSNAIELNLACYYLSAQSPVASNEKIGDEQTAFIVENAENPYWRNAVSLDPTGRLARSFGKSFTAHFASTEESRSYYEQGSWY